MAPKSRHQVIVVGGGLSGMSAAKLLLEASVDVLVLEADERVGGRTYTKKVPGAECVELGGEYSAPGQKHVLRLARNLGVEKYAIGQGAGSTVYYDETSGSFRRFASGQRPCIRNPLVILDMNNFFRSIEQLSREVPLHAPWEAARAEQWDQMTVKEYANKVVWTQTTMDLVNTICSSKVNMNPHETSLLWFLWYIRQYGSVKPLVNGAAGKMWKFVGGSMQLCEKIAHQLGESRVLLNKPVVGVRQADDFVTVTTLDGCAYESDRVVFTVPPATEQKIHFEPAMSEARVQLVQKAPMGSLVKVVVCYPTAFWHERGLSGAAVIKALDVDQHPLAFTEDGTWPDGSHACLVGHLFTDRARHLTAATDRQERSRRIVKSLAIVFNDDRFLEPLAYEEFDWATHQYVGGGSKTVFPPGCLTTYGKILREPVNERIFFAGTATATAWPGYMDGAVSSGERAARQALNAMGKVSEDQIWIDEPDSKDDVAMVEVPFTRTELLLPSVGGLVTFLKVVGVVGIVAVALYFSRLIRLW